MGLTDEAGRSLVRRVTRTSATVQAALNSRLPDLIAHWEHAAFAAPLRVKGFNLMSEAIGTKFTGQHALAGFCILRSDQTFVEGDVLPATKIGEVLTRMVSKAKLTTELELSSFAEALPRKSIRW